MYNSFLSPLLDDDPKRTITPFGVKMRKMMHPLVKRILPLTVKRKLILVSRPIKTRKPTIFVSTHEFREDCEAAFNAAGVSLYLVNGSVSVVMNSIDGITNWITGMILVDRASKSSRRAAKDKMIYALKNGANILIYPEGTWNKSPNQIISGLYPGVYEEAKETGAQIIPIANQREEGAVYSTVGAPFYITDMEREDAMETVKEHLATLRWKLIERSGLHRREAFPSGRELDRLWKEHIDGLMAEVPFYDYELEKHTKYREKGVVSPDEVYTFFRKIKPSFANAFLFRNNEGLWYESKV